jgi:LPXTG-motif cell wall-anchored protein
VQAATVKVPVTGAAQAEGPFGIGIGLVIAGLAMLGLSFRRRDTVS